MGQWGNGGSPSGHERAGTYVVCEPGVDAAISPRPHAMPLTMPHDVCVSVCLCLSLSLSTSLCLCASLPVCVCLCVPGGVQELLSSGADVNAATKALYTPLHIAAHHGSSLVSFPPPLLPPPPPPFFSFSLSLVGLLVAERQALNPSRSNLPL